MPRLADHDQRKSQITDAARRAIARDGLHAATFQSIASEAGVSVRLVQYYFGTKRALLEATHHAVAVDAGHRFSRRLAALDDDAPPRAVIHALLAELLPTDAARRRDAVVLAAFHAAVLTGPEADVDVTTTAGATRYLAAAIAAQLHRVNDPRNGDGATDDAADDDAALTAEVIVAAAAGLTQAMVTDPSTAERGDLLLGRLLDAFLPAGPA